MGLAERRAMLDFQNTIYPDLKKQVVEAAGFEVPLEINWDSLVESGPSHLYKGSLPKIYFEPLIAALKSLCADDLGKEAVKQSLKKVEILSTGKFYEGAGFSYEGGVLKLDDRIINDQEVRTRTNAIISVMEKAL